MDLPNTEKQYKPKRINEESEMTDQEKLAILEDIMELDEGTLTADTDLDDIEEWDSLAALSFVVMLADDFGKKITGAEIRAFNTVQDMLITMEEAE